MHSFVRDSEKFLCLLVFNVIRCPGEENDAESRDNINQGNLDPDRSMVDAHLCIRSDKANHDLIKIGKDSYGTYHGEEDNYGLEVAVEVDTKFAISAPVLSQPAIFTPGICRFAISTPCDC